MSKLGLVGGLAWISTVEYYSQIHRAVEETADGFANAEKPWQFEMSIESLDLKTALSLAGNGNDDQSWSAFDAYHRDALLRLQQSGVECAAIASNTPHIRYEAITEGVSIPVVDMFTALADEVARREAEQVLVLGTPLTMRSERLKNVLRSHGVRAIAVTNEHVIAEVFELIGLLQAGQIRGCADKLGAIVKCVWDGGPQVQPPHVILSCTELPLAFPERPLEKVFTSGGVVYIDSMAVHIEAILKCLKSSRDRK